MTYLTAIRQAAPFLIEMRTLAWVVTRNPSPPLLCPCCGKTSRFRTFGLPPRLNAVCARCGSRERHRLMRLYFDQNPEVVTGGTVLHFAPETIIRSYLEPMAAEYVACDLFPKAGEIEIDIEAIAQPAGKFSLVVCSHVLEHVDDRAALREMYRVLRPGGTLLLMFPLIEGWDETFEAPAVVRAAERLRYFGQEDHLRYFGRDVRDRIRSAGFTLSEYTAVEPAVSTYGLIRGEKIFVATRPA